MTNFPIGKLKKAMDDLLADEALQPKKGATYCNIATFKLVQGLGFPYFWREKADRPMMANEMIDYMDTHPLQFSKLFNPITAYDMANNGYCVLAALKDQPHGHICAVAPIQQLITSGRFKCQVPTVCNIGKKNEYMGLNYAFSEMPNFYICL
jgi:hypothetical protein